ncbi:MAG: IMS domain-containing protein [Thermosynechococcaceae cyanobacterium MS004]|nr:IMS domain-containing protein [Thermosynechococcaceae cyanobacterium MS004]
MQIPLDFYRILGVPHRATLEQLQQAFDDRLQQLPRQEYSNGAIAARKQLLEEAYVTLADPEKRQAYDAKLNAQEVSTAIGERLGAELEGAELEGVKFEGVAFETPDNQLAGVLLVLQEVGAYPQILEIGSAYLERPIDLAKLPLSAGAVEDDVILAMALANLELGREQWQQSQFEVAGKSLQAGLALLEQEQKSPGIQAEIRGDLFKLRPYRILDALTHEEPEQRQAGLTLLQAMLDDRDGIDGNQDDQSGLTVNDFLRFVQQLREYLTVEEQQTLFEREAARPSAVASYLAVYALIARGVSEGTPALIQRAKTLLTQLSDRQDVAVEVGMCWLLLGQPTAAHQSVEFSEDADSLAFMRQYSEGAPDLIPGLYLYTENWLQQEVYPYFRDLLDRKVSLQHYFDDPAIQKTLSALESTWSGSAKTQLKQTPALEPGSAIATAPAPSTLAPDFTADSLSFAPDHLQNLEIKQPAAKQAGAQQDTHRPQERAKQKSSLGRQEAQASQDAQTSAAAWAALLGKGTGETSDPWITDSWSTELGSAGLSSAELSSAELSPTELGASAAPFVTGDRQVPSSRASSGGAPPGDANNAPRRQGRTRSPLPQNAPDQTQALRYKTRLGQSRAGQQEKAAAGSPAHPRKKRLRRWVPWVIAALLGTGAVAGALALGRLFNPERSLVNSPTSSPPLAPSQPSASSGGTKTPAANAGGQPSAATAGASSPVSTPSANPTTQGTTQSPTVQGGSSPVPGSATASTPSVVRPAGAPAPTAASGNLSSADAKQLVQSWQAAKAEAMGETSQIDKLKTVLAEPILGEWEYSANQVQQSQGHWKYTLDELNIESVKTVGKGQSLIQAQVKEKAQYYENGKLVSDRSYSDNYRVQYSAIQKGQQWLIRGMEVLK